MSRMIKTITLTLFMVSALSHAEQAWTINTQEEWEAQNAASTEIEIKDGLAAPLKESATFQSKIKTFSEKTSAQSITLSQSASWLDWESAGQVGPKNLNDAPVFLRHGDGDYWVFGRYGTNVAKSLGKGKKAKQEKKKKEAEALEVLPKAGEPATLDGFDIPLYSTPYENQFDADGGLQKPIGGYHAWQSKDMVNWVHHGPVSDTESRWMTTAEYVDGKTYLYYDFPNDQDPHLIIDEDLTDGKVGKKMGMAFKDPSHGSDSTIIRDLEGKFHLILENWDPISANKRSWDSPLASHAVSDDGISEFKLVDPAVDYRTEPTGKFGTFKHPHWSKEDPKNYPSNEAKYEIHEPVQEAYGDWASIAIGGQYYLFGDYDPAGAHGSANMSTAWFTSASINEPFTFCDHIGKGHPDPDIMYAEGRFYLITQTEDFVSDGPWTGKAEVRVGVDTDEDGSIDQWTDWQEVKESYAAVDGFAKQVAKTPAALDLSGLPEGFGFQFEVKLTDTTKNKAKPVLDKVELLFN